jgi:hypothetical protein
MSNRRKLVKTVNGVRTKYDNEFMVIYKDYEWNEFIVKNKSEPQFDSDGTEFGLFETDEAEAIHYFETQSAKFYIAKAEKLKAEFAKLTCDHLNNGSF